MSKYKRLYDVDDPSEFGDQPFVDKYYEMNPEREVLLFDSTALEDGMIILAANPVDRGPNLHEHSVAHQIDDARERNRWCIIEDVSYEDHGEESRVAFIATYKDGSKRKRTCHPTTPWLSRIITKSQ